MRTLALALLPVIAGLLATSCTSTRSTTTTKAAPPRLPRYREPFTSALPCPRKPATTLDIEGCAERDIIRTDAAIEARAKAVFSLLTPKGRREFVSAERSWLTYRKASCNVAASKYAGGTLEPVAFGLCVVKKNRSHLEELSALQRDLRGP